MKTCLLILVTVCAFSCGVAQDAAKSSDQAIIQGTWLAQTESLNGSTKKVTFVYIFKTDTLTFIDENEKETTYSYKLDTTGNLKFIVLQPGETPVAVGYVLNGDSLTLVIAPAGLRPTEISDRNNQELIICKRKR